MRVLIDKQVKAAGEMKNTNIKMSLILIVTLILFGCVENNSNHILDKNDSEKKDQNFDADTTVYDPLSVDDLMAASIKNFLVNSFLKDDLQFLTENDRNFQMSKIDLNNDSKDEYFIRLMGDFFCGRGGCTFLLLDRYSEVITKFTVMDAPIYVLKNKQHGWQNLSVYNNGSDRILKFDGNKYPSNPSVAPAYLLKDNEVMQTLFDDQKQPAFTYKF